MQPAFKLPARGCVSVQFGLGIPAPGRVSGQHRSDEAESKADAVSGFGLWIVIMNAIDWLTRRQHWHCAQLWRCRLLTIIVVSMLGTAWMWTCGAAMIVAIQAATWSPWFPPDPIAQDGDTGGGKVIPLQFCLSARELGDRPVRHYEDLEVGNS